MAIDIHIGDRYPTRWSRREPWGLFWPVSISADRRVELVTFQMEGDGSGPFQFPFLGEQDGRYWYGAAWKPPISGEWEPLVKAWERIAGGRVVRGQPIVGEGLSAMRRGPHRVIVTEDPVIVPADPVGPAPFVIRAAFYYSWFTGLDGWGAIGTVYHPTRGRYDLNNIAVIDQHVRDHEYAKCDAAIATWWGIGHKTDGRFPVLLERSEGHALKWCIYHEMEGHTDPSPEQIRRDLAYIRERYAGHPNYLKINGKFVVFVYSANDGSDCEVTTRWKQASDGDVYIVMKALGSVHHLDCPDQPDGWHQYDTTKDVQVTWDATGKVESYYISPGFWNGFEPAPMLERDIRRWRRNVREMVASGARWQLVPFNEWGEGSAVESAAEWASDSGYGAYLDALHTDGRE